MLLRTILALLLACSSCAHAQLRLPGVQLPSLGSTLNAPILRDTERRVADTADRIDLRSLRLDQVTDLLHRHAKELEADPRGEPVVRHEILAWSPSAAGLAAAAALGLEAVGDARDGFLTLRLPEGGSTRGILEKLRSSDPQGIYDFNHVYTRSGAVGAAAAAAPSAAAGSKVRVGLVDGGVDAAHEVFRAAALTPWGCDGSTHPNPHGTAVAALMVGQSSSFHGVAPQAALYTADIYCDSPTGGSAARIAQALAWLGREQVAVINISLVGPSNRILEMAVQRLAQRGHLLVAAVGNDGPAAPPLYPASYPGVVGVTGVDRTGKVLPEAARGPQVMFAAPGSKLVSAATGSPPFRTVRGTSFAAPIVAALLAAELTVPDPAAAAAALSKLAATASSPRREETGLGIVGKKMFTAMD